MRFEIKASPRGGLKVIPLIPSHQICRVEGYNGVGKSTAIRILQLCVGDQPFAESEQLWRTFREKIGRVRVRVSGLEGAGEITWELDPAKWPTTPQPLEDSLGEVRIDGQSKTLPDVKRLLAVHRIVGNEGLTATLAAQLDSYRAALSAWFAPGGAVRARLGELDAFLIDLSDVVRPLETGLATQITTAQTAAAALEQHRRRRRAVEQRREMLEQALVIMTQIQELSDGADDLDGQITQLDKEAAAVATSLQDLDRRMAELNSRLQASEAAQEEFVRAQRYAGRCSKALEAAAITLQAAAAAADIHASESAVAVAVSTNKQLLEDLLGQLPSVYAGPLVAELAVELSDRLVRAEEQGLGDQVLVEDDDWEVRLTVAELRDALTRVAQRRGGEPVSERAAALNREIEAVRGRLLSLERVGSALQAHAESDQKNAKAAERLRAATEALPGDEIESRRDLLRQRERLLEHAREAAIRRAELVRARQTLGGGHSEPELRDRLAQLLHHVDVSEDGVSHALGEAERDAERLRDEEAVARAASDAAEQALRSARRKLRDAAVALREDDGFRWVRAGLGDWLPTPDQEADVQEAKLARLGVAVEELRGRIESFNRQVGAVQDALGGVAGDLRGQPTGAEQFVERVRRWFGAEVSRWFDHDQIRQALFPGGQNARVDLGELTVSWREGHLEQSRPLQAFSSGERAFAYTRAQLAQLDLRPRPVSNRLIAMDEFGAFIARDRLRRLGRYLQERRQSHPEDQVLLVLPLTVDPEDLDRAGDLGRERRRQLKQRGYFAEEFVEA